MGLLSRPRASLAGGGEVGISGGEKELRRSRQKRRGCGLAVPVRGWEPCRCARRRSSPTVPLYPARA
eukprot:366029-Chlamydomonas_euryale.AAC.44